MEAKASTGSVRAAAPRVVIDRKLRLRVAGLAGKRRRATGADTARSKRRVTAAASSDDRGSADDAMQRIEALLAASERSASDKRVASQTLTGLLAQTQSALRDRVRLTPLIAQIHARCAPETQLYLRACQVGNQLGRSSRPAARGEGPGPGEASSADVVHPEQDRGELLGPAIFEHETFLVAHRVPFSVASRMGTQPIR